MFSAIFAVTVLSSLLSVGTCGNLYEDITVDCGLVNCSKALLTGASNFLCTTDSVCADLVFQFEDATLKDTNDCAANNACFNTELTLRNSPFGLETTGLRCHKAGVSDCCSQMTLTLAGDSSLYVDCNKEDTSICKRMVVHLYDSAKLRMKNKATTFSEGALTVYLYGDGAQFTSDVTSANAGDILVILMTTQTPQSTEKQSTEKQSPDDTTATAESHSSGGSSNSSWLILVAVAVGVVCILAICVAAYLWYRLTQEWKKHSSADSSAPGYRPRSRLQSNTNTEVNGRVEGESAHMIQSDQMPLAVVAMDGIGELSLEVSSSEELGIGTAVKVRAEDRRTSEGVVHKPKRKKTKVKATTKGLPKGYEEEDARRDTEMEDELMYLPMPEAIHTTAGGP